MGLKYDKKKLTSLCIKNQIRYLALFGSFSRGDADKNSDVDLLVDFIKSPSLLEHVGIEYEFSKAVFGNRKVDLVTKRSLNRYIAPHISKDLVTLYERN